MNSKEIVQKLNLELSDQELKEIKNKTIFVTKEIDKEIKRKKIKAEAFVGGSFAKGTIVKREKYDVDIFVRFDEKYENPDETLKKILGEVQNKVAMKLKIIHGSRDYFALEENKLTYEIVPVKKISNPKDASNSTDLSYFHVGYVKKSINKKPKLKQEIIIAKAFCRGQGVYGAESWVHGFSGYALECLVIHFGSFQKMLKELIKVEKQIIIDPEKKFKKKEEILIDLNESKRKGPIILIDPTYKSRNVTAALSEDKFKEFQESARKYLKNPSLKFFKAEEIDRKTLKLRAQKLKSDFVAIEIATEKQEGDIAGSKLEKFYRFIIEEISRRYQIKENFFVFDEKNSAKVYLIAKPNKDIVQRGPPLGMEEHVKIFRKLHPDAFVKSGSLYISIKEESLPSFLVKWKEKNLERIKEMDISEIKIEN